MRKNRVCRAEYSGDSSPSEVKMAVECIKKNYNVYFKSDNIQLSQSAEALITAISLPCILNGISCGNQDFVSRRFKNGLKEIINITKEWGWTKGKVQFENLREREDSLAQGKRVGCFFSGGGDSFYSLLKHRDEITDLIFIHGFDISLAKRELRKEVSDSLRSAAEAFGKNLIEIETNIRDFHDLYVGWEEGHGAVLAVVAHIVSSSFRKIFIPSSFCYEDLHPWGSHPNLDPNWSSDLMDLSHDGYEKNKFKKYELIVKNKVALNTLRVCWENRDGAYNCGKCGKCIRNMIMLKAWGVKGNPKSFSTPLSLEAVRQLKIIKTGERISAISILNDLKKSGKFPEFVEAMEYALTQKHYIRGFKRKTLEFLRRIKKNLLV